MSTDARLGSLLGQVEALEARGIAITPAVLQAICQDDPELLEQLQELRADEARLKQQLRPELLESDDVRLASTPAQAGSASSNGSTTVRSPVGRFTPRAFHAKGGLGEVYRANDTEVGRDVALKCIQDRFAYQEDKRQRFLREAQITARLEHPGVVPIYGIVHDAAGQPFYAMRFIEGASLKDAIHQFHGERGGVSPPSLERRNQQALGVLTQSRSPAFASLEFRQLLQRFISVCNTIAFAHSRGIVHRDLKPANIMLGDYGETLVVDWGLAKCFSEPEASAKCSVDAPSLTVGAPTDPLTETGQLLGTPAYMSPEQARGEPVGPPSDIYSLGATLYHLLTGQPRFASTPRLNHLEWLDRVQRSDFSRPRQLNPHVPAPLEAICLHAMKTDPTQRYPSATALADDLNRWLADEPVTAYAEPWTVRLRRWGRRHRTLVASVGLLLLVVVPTVSIGGMLLQHERARADNNRAIAEIKEKAAAQITDYLVRSYQSADPLGMDAPGFQGPKDRTREELARRMLDRGDELVREHLKDQPLVRASLLDAMGNSYRALGQMQRAEELITLALKTRREQLGEDHPDTATSLFHLGWLRHDEGRIAEAEELYRKALAARRQQFGPTSLEIAAVEFNLAWLLVTHFEAARGTTPPRWREAELYLDNVIQIRKKLLGAKNPKVGEALLMQAFLCHTVNGEGRDLKSLRLLQEADGILGFKEEKDRLSAIGWKLYEANRLRATELPKAAELMRQVVATTRERLGNDHPLTAMALIGLAGVLQESRDMVGAELTVREALDIQRRAFGAHPVMIDPLLKLADHVAKRDSASANILYQEAAAIARRFLKPDAELRKSAEERLRD